MAPSTSLLLLPFFIAAAFGDNDWSKPCLSGECQYDLPATSESSASGTLKIWGSPNAISDITPAAGWEILGCSPDSLSQDIRLVCKDGSSADCAHLYSGGSDPASAVGKIVRLPQDCGKNPFAVVTKAYTLQDQTIPANATSALARRDGTKPTVHGLSLDTNFKAVTKPPAGAVNFAIRAANVPGANGDLPTGPQRRSNSRIYGRGLGDFISSAVDAVSNLDSFNVNNTKQLSPFDIDKTFNVFQDSISCPPITAGISIDVDAKAHADVSLGIAATGTVVPPLVTGFSIFGEITGSIDGSIDIKGSASATIDSGKIKLFEVGIPGLDFPGILTIGPSFEINGEATATLDLDVDMTVGVSYTIGSAQFTFPPTGLNSPAASAGIGDTSLKLSTGASVEATGKVTAHLIPTLNLGISALDDIVSANVFVDLDASASMTLTVQAGASASTTVNPTDVAPVDTATTAGGCFEMDAGFDINIGADANFFDFFNPSTQETLFSKNFQILKKCFGNGVPTSRRALSRSYTPRSVLSSRFFPSSLESINGRATGLSCLTPGKSSSTQQSLDDETVSAGAITEE